MKRRMVMMIRRRVRTSASATRLRNQKATVAVVEREEEGRRIS
jgi:hypothetical protein